MKTYKTSNKPWSVMTALALSAVLAQGQPSPAKKAMTPQQPPKVVLPMSKTPVNQSPVKANEKLQKVPQPLTVPKQNGHPTKVGAKKPQATSSQTVKQAESAKNPTVSKSTTQGVQKSKPHGKEANKGAKPPRLTTAQQLVGVGVPEAVANSLGMRADRGDIEALKTARLVTYAAGQLQLAGASQELQIKSLKEIIDRRLTDPSPGGAADQIIGNAYVQSSPFLGEGKSKMPAWANAGLTVRSSLAAAANLQGIGLTPDDPAYRSTIDTMLRDGLSGQSANNVVGATAIKTYLGLDNLPGSTKGKEWNVARGVLTADVILQGAGIERGSRTFNIIMGSVLNQGLGPKDAGRLAWDAAESVLEGVPNSSGTGLPGYSGRPGTQAGNAGQEPRQNSGDETSGNATPTEELHDHGLPPVYIKYDDDEPSGSTPAGSEPSGGSSNPDTGSGTDGKGNEPSKYDPANAESIEFVDTSGDDNEYSGTRVYRFADGTVVTEVIDSNNNVVSRHEEHPDTSSEDSSRPRDPESGQRLLPTEAEIRAWWSSGARPPIGAGKGAQPENPTGGGNDVVYTSGTGPIPDRKGTLLGGDPAERVTKTKPPIGQFTGRPVTKPGGAQPESPSGGVDGTGSRPGQTGSGPLPKNPMTDH